MDSQKIKRLLGTELAQDDPNFIKYAIQREELLEPLRDRNNQFLIINAARGSGKSGLLLSHEFDIKSANTASDIVIKKFYGDAPLPEKFETFHSALHFWKNTILGWIVSQIGANLSSPSDPDQVVAANYAEALGNREIDQTLLQLRVNQPAIAKTDFDERLTDGYLSRLIEKSGKHFWILLDEMDDYYENSPNINNKLIGLLKSAKHIVKLHRNIYVRLTIRPHIMTTLYRTSDVAQTFRGDELKISWNEKTLLKLLAKRIENYEGPDNSQLPLFGGAQEKENDWRTLNKTVEKYFEPFDASLEQSRREMGFKGLVTYSIERPRWMLELCRLALESSNGDKATIRDFRIAVAEYSRNRVIFLAGEHKYHMPEFEAIANQIAAERKWKLGDSKSLKNLIIKRVIRAGIKPVRKDGVLEDEIINLENTAALKIAQDLYMIDFIRAHQSLGGKGRHRFYTYNNRPSLLTSWSEEPNISWELHPTFARSFNILDTGTYFAGGEDKLFRERRWEE